MNNSRMTNFIIAAVLILLPVARRNCATDNRLFISVNDLRAFKAPILVFILVLILKPPWLKVINKVSHLFTRYYGSVLLTTTTDIHNITAIYFYHSRIMKHCIICEDEFTNKPETNN